MKGIIKNILREHSGMKNDWQQKHFIGAKLIAQRWDDAKFKEWTELDGDPWYRKEALEPMLKLINLDLHGTDISQLFWLAYDNREGLREDTINSYQDLKKRPLKTYEVSITEQELESIEYNYKVLIDAYAEQDAWEEVIQNEDGEYHWWDYEDSEGFDKEVYDSETRERDVNEIKEVAIDGVSIVKEQITASPVENDIISELEGLIENWDGCEEGMRVACKYKNQVQEIIDNYKNKGLYEHTDNFTSHFDEPKIGEPIVNTNPGCTHYKSEGFIEDINDLPDDKGTTITYRVTNNGETYQEGDTLTKTMDQLSPLVNEQYQREGGEGYPIVITDIDAHLMELFKNRLGDEKIKELVNTDIWNLHETEQYTKLLNINDGTKIKQIIQFMVDKGLPQKYKEFVGENLPSIHIYNFTRTYEQTATIIYDSTVSLEDTNYTSALCAAKENWWEYDPEDEELETLDTDYVGNEEWERVEKDGKQVWHARGNTNDDNNDDNYDPNNTAC